MPAICSVSFADSLPAHRGPVEHPLGEQRGQLAFACGQRGAPRVRRAGVDVGAVNQPAVNITVPQQGQHRGLHQLVERFFGQSADMLAGAGPAGVDRAADPAGPGGVQAGAADPADRHPGQQAFALER